MSRNLAAAALTAVLIAGAVIYSLRQKPAEPQGPDSAVWRLQDAAKSGDTDAYLDCFSGALRTQLEVSAREMSREGFAKYLRENNARVKGVAVFDVQAGGDGTASLTVEYVFADGQDRQRLGLRLADGVWRIESAGATSRIQPLVPYGTPVADAP